MNLELLCKLEVIWPVQDGGSWSTMSILTKSHSLESWVFTKSLDRGSSPKWMTHHSHLIQVHATLQVLNRNGLWHQRIAWENIVMDACLNSFPGSSQFLQHTALFKIFFLQQKAENKVLDWRGGYWMTVLIQLHTALCLVYYQRWFMSSPGTVWSQSSRPSCYAEILLHWVVSPGLVLLSHLWHVGIPVREAKGWEGREGRKRGQAQMSWCVFPQSCAMTNLRTCLFLKGNLFSVFGQQ